MHRYMYLCKKCGHHEECPDKADWKIARKTHKKDGCKLLMAPIEKGEEGAWVWARPDLAEDMRSKWEKKTEKENESNPTNGQERVVEESGVSPSQEEHPV